MEFFRQLIQGIAAAWGKLNTSARVNIAIAGAVVIAAIVILVAWGSRPNYVVLFSNLSGDDVAKIVSELRDRDVPYQITSGGTAVRVPSATVYELRNELAGKGLPRGGGVGFEVFDRTTIGVTDFVQRINYERALTTELARTISALDAVRNARVHLTLPEEALFAEEQEEPSASVVVALTRPGALSGPQINGVLHLLATAVEGLRASNITVVDTQGNVLARPSDAPESVAGHTSKQLDALTEYEKYLESKATDALRKVLGPRRYVVTVSATLDFDEVKTEAIDYEDGILKDEETSQEQMTTRQALPVGPPGMTSGLPRVGGATSGTLTEKTSETMSTTFVTPETYTSTKKAPGTVKKLNVAALIEGKYETDEESGERTYLAMESGEIEKLRGVVAAAVNLDETRGDVITVNDMPFEEAAIELEVPGVPWYAGLPVAQIVLGVAAVVAFVLLRSVLSKMAAAPPAPVPEFAPVEEYPVTEEAALKEKVKEEISRLSREQPETVASVLRTWLAEE